MNDTSYEQVNPQQNVDYNQPYIQPSNYGYSQPPVNFQQNAIYPQQGQVGYNVQNPFQNLPNSGDGCGYPKQIICPYCNKVITTTINHRIGSGTILWCIIILLIFWPLFWLPFVMADCKDKVHKCTQCGHDVGIKKYKMC